MEKYRSIWISDLHLGINGCKADDLCKFLKANTCDHLYLVGDIIDGWKLKRGWNWPQSHSNVIRRLLTSAKRGTTLTYITGNHDEFLRDWVRFGIRVGNIKIVDECEHIGVTGHRYLVVHGDMFDAVTRNYKWISVLGDISYELLLTINSGLNKTRKWFGYGYWSLSRYIKRNAKQAVNFIFEFERHLAKHAGDAGYHGVICGHIHFPEIKLIGNLVYMNSGDWVETCSAIVENWDGSFELLLLINDEMHIEGSYNPTLGEIT
jgi:UDP-2,3-diacylglucosamine pyrophosphatase LpxH